MGKYAQQNQRHNLEAGGNPESSGFLCEGCSKGLSQLFSLRCVVFLVLGFAVFLSGFFWLLPIRPKSGFDAKDAIKLSASIQAYFRLQKPASELVPYRARLEQEIFDEIALPNAKVVILSMHQSVASNATDVVFAVLSDPIDFTINQALLSLLRSSLIEIFFQPMNLTLTTSIFGQASMFQILKFPGGITVIPTESAPVWEIPQILFNFTLNNSISEIQDAFVQLKEQLKFGLHLRPYENIYIQVTNQEGSTVSHPVIVQTSVVSSMGNLLPQRLKQLTRIITASPAKNLGLDNSVFGKVKSVSLSTYLKDKDRPVAAPAPAPASSPTPARAPSPSPSISPSPSCSPEA